MNLNSLLKLSSVKRYNKDAPILKEGAKGPEEMLIILQGQVGVFKDYGAPGQTLLQILGPGDFVGERGLFLGLEPLSTNVALEPIIAVAITRQNSTEFFATQPEMTFTVISHICEMHENLRKEHEALIADVRSGVATKKLQAAESKASRTSKLFPEGHGSYQLPINNALDEYLYEDTVTCPLCKYVFPNLFVIVSKLRRDGDTERDQRVRYKDIEPMFYEIVSCPGCLFAAEKEAFLGASKRIAEKVKDEVSRFRSELHLKAGYERDTFTIFAGYYLALHCAPYSHDDYQMEQASLWQKLSRMYSDIGDQEMSDLAIKNALEKYRYSYENIRMSPGREQQVGFVIGDILQRLGDLDEARQFFYNVKINKMGSPIFKRQAELRLEETREILNKKKREEKES